MLADNMQNTVGCKSR